MTEKKMFVNFPKFSLFSFPALKKTCFRCIIHKIKIKKKLQKKKENKMKKLISVIEVRFTIWVFN